MPSRRSFLPLMTAALVATPALAAPPSRQVDAPSSTQSLPVAAAPQTGGSLVLKLRRSPTTVDLLVEGAGPSPVLRQGGNGSDWLGELRTATPTGLRLGPQRISLPEAGLQTISLTGSGTDYQIQVTPLSGTPLSRPVVSADGNNLIISFAASTGASYPPTARLDLSQPGSIPQSSFAPPLQARAVAPPLGDMAVGSMILRNQSFVNASGPNVTLTLRNAPAKDALMAIAHLGGYGFVFVDDSAPAGGSGSQPATAPGSSRQVTISFRNEGYAKALNSVLLSAGLQGKRDGNMILVGPSVLGKGFGAQMSKVYRLNQASAASAADYLASLGASITKVSVITNSVTQGETQSNAIAGGPASQQTQTQQITTTETYGGGVGPLKGLIGTTDSRLQTVTLIGDSQLVSVAEGYLRQIDLRQRQVALSVKILDVSLDNEAAISNSFAFRYGNNFIVSDRGELVGSFGGLLPPNAGAVGTGIGYPYNFPAQPPANPGLLYPRDNFFNVVQALITSASAKTLASPTLFLTDNPEPNFRAGGGASRGGGGSSSGGVSVQVQPVTDPSSPIGRNYANEAFVVVGENVVQSYTVNQGSNGAPNTCQPIFGVAGLTLGARVKRIDDNGFVSFNLSPAITAVTQGQTRIEGCGVLNTLTVRALDTGDVRVRDGQTLILTGVISDADVQAVRKWPILGDIPFVGQFFRDSTGGRKKRELVILVTPKIVSDVEGGGYGYGYRPETREAKGFMGSYN